MGALQEETQPQPQPISRGQRLEGATYTTHREATPERGSRRRYARTHTITPHTQQPHRTSFSIAPCAALLSLTRLSSRSPLCARGCDVV